MLGVVVLTALLLTGVSVNVDVVKPKAWLFFEQDVGVGQGVELKFTVKNTGNVIAKFNKIRVIIYDPSGKKAFDKTFNIGTVILNPNDYKEFDLKTGYVVDKVGTWKVIIQIYDGNTKIGEATKTFEVVSPSVEVGNVDIIGYAIAGASMAGIGYVVGRRFGGK